MSKCPLIAKAIVYAVRQGALINQYGFSWNDIETNTCAVLDGAPIPPDGKMAPLKCPEPSAVDRGGLIDKYHAIKRELANAQDEVSNLRRMLQNQHRHMLTRLRERDEARKEAKSGTPLSTRCGR
jgi:hypothetical protein